MHNHKARIHRFIINRGEAVVTFDPSFKRFRYVLDFKYLNCRGVKIDNYTQILPQRNGRISNRFAFVFKVLVFIKAIRSRDCLPVKCGKCKVSKFGNNC